MRVDRILIPVLSVCTLAAGLSQAALDWTGGGVRQSATDLPGHQLE